MLHRARNILQKRTESGTAVAVLSEWQLGINEAYLVRPSLFNRTSCAEANSQQIAFEAALIDGMAGKIESYGLDLMKPVSTRLWLTDEAIVDDLRYVYHQSVKLLQARSAHFGSAIDDTVDAQDEATLEQQRKQQVLKDQTSRMVYPLCYALEACARYAAQYVAEDADWNGTDVKMPTANWRNNRIRGARFSIMSGMKMTCRKQLLP